MSLSDREQKVLDELERQLMATDPRLGSLLPNGWRRAKAMAYLGLAVSGALTGVALVLVGLAFGAILISIIGFLVIVTAVAAVTTRRGPARAVWSATTSGWAKRKPRGPRP